ncbi:NAD-dependent epimerase/dehydratase family protein [Cupriavidus basilensis]|uniref:NAD-dependent epimerase/dehydratase family protein n=1 Tax=Cupriavidus basilensis TaxID=68895 RepID=UPI0007512727|nr:SDR family NAD(P)-dependent oxidoreductase [Cupriavidus basilensis]
MTILVTGATSGLGRNAVDALLRDGIAVRATGRNLAAGEALERNGAEFVPADLATLDEAKADALLHGVDAVWHCAALSAPWGRHADFVAANVSATRHMAQAAAVRGVRRFVHVSTPSIYFDYRHHRGIEETYRAARLANHYAATKAAAEDRILTLSSQWRGTTFVILRPRGLFGPHDRVIVPRILQLLRSRHGVLPLPRGGKAFIDMTYVGNVVHAMKTATHAPVASGEAFNITNFEPCTLASMLQRLLGDGLGLRYRIRALPYPLLDAAARAAELGARLRRREPLLTRYGIGALHFDMTLSNARARQRLGYHPRHGIDEGIRLTADWIRGHGDHYGI